MRTELCKKLGIEFPIFAFTHCRDVVAAVTNAGGFGVLGATGFGPEQLEIELNWIDEKVGNKPYGVDVIIPNKYEGQDVRDPEKHKAIIKAAIPQRHRDFARQLLEDHNVPELPEGKPYRERVTMTENTAVPLVDVALKHDNVKLIANALGTPPPHVIKQIQDSGRMVGALCGKPAHAQYHVDAGLDFIIAQGGEGGGHTGDIGSVVLWPEVVKVAGDIPVIAAGGIGSGEQMAAALALGAQGVWCGSIWLTVSEAETSETVKELMFAADSSGTVRSKSFTGKHVRMLKNAWSEGWDAEGNPESLGAPMQMMVSGSALARIHRYPEQAKELAFAPVGQIVGSMNHSISSRNLLMDMVNGYLASTERLSALLED
ncbi:MAG: nitronate monooxygenase [Pseudomonadales bacterium]|nr:nitronate monooxygenase [Pseudomonadales bacterium]